MINYDAKNLLRSKTRKLLLMNKNSKSFAKSFLPKYISEIDISKS